MILALALFALGLLTWPPAAAPRFVPSHPGRGRGPDGAVGDPLLARGNVRGSGGGADESVSTVDDLADAVVLLSLALRGGVAVTAAIDTVAEVTSGQVRADLRSVAAAYRWGMPPAEVWNDLDPVWRPVALAWAAAERAGVPPAGLLLSAAQRLREREAARLEARLQRAGVLLVLPLGGLFLPGFIATTVLPVVVHLVGHLRG